jgi:acyl carrier protein
MTKVYDLSKIDEDLKNKIIEKISIIKDMKEKEKIKDNSNLVLDLYFDSLDLAEIKSYIQANFSGSSNPPITDLRTIADLYMMAI